MTQLAAAAAVVFASALAPMSAVQAADAGASAIEQGKAVAHNRKKGNCLACHMIAGGTSPGTVAPPLVAMKQRYPDKAKLRAQIYDPEKNNPETVMPPFGKHKILTEKEIDVLVEYIWSL
jgi:sulfur-oxidizing protein SoxX